MTIPADILAAARAAHAKFYPLGPFVSITLAQWADESNWGKAPSGKNNYFGIKATPAQIAAGQATSRMTGETLGGVYRKLPQYFADYTSVEDCFTQHAGLLVHPHYIDCQRAATPDAYAHALWKDGYATGIPGHPYDVALIDIMMSNNLYQYDQTPGESPMTEATVTTAPATPSSPARVVPTATQPVRIAWQDWLEQLLVHETPLIETAAQTGVDIGAAAIPGGIGSLLVGMLGPTIVKQTVDGVVATIGGALSNSDLTVTVPASDTIATMAANVLNSTVPTFATKAEGLLDGWIKSAVSAVTPK